MRERLRSHLALSLGWAIATALVFAVGFLPLFGGPGYEHTLATGLLVPASVSISVALDASRKRARPPLVMCMVHAMGVGALFAMGAFATALVHLLHVRACEPFAQLSLFFFGPFVGCILAGLYGTLVGEVARQRKRRRLFAVVFGLIGPLSCALFSVGRFYRSPMVFAFDPFVGYFSGTLYDTIVDPGEAIYTYRLGSLATVAACLSGATFFRREEDADGALRLWRGGPHARWLFGAFAFALAASLWVTSQGPRFGHWHTRESIEAGLGGSIDGPRCHVVYPKGTKRADAELLLRDCETALVTVEHNMQVQGPARVTAFFFRDADEKKRFMGAAHTYIAKPWRDEVYLQVATFPHPVLQHELAHVVAGKMARGPFRIAGKVGGVLPDPGLIEGVAEAFAPNDDDLTYAQWARAMKELGILPPVSRLFSLGFLGEASSKSYTLAGAFVEYVVARYGMGTLHAWYGGADIEALSRKRWPELDSDFRAYLDTIPLPPSAKDFASAKFKKPSMFGRACPHVVDRVKHEADVCRDTQDIVCARAKYGDVLAMDAHDFGAEYGRAIAELRSGDERKGVSELERLSKTDLAPRTIRDRAKEALADREVLLDKMLTLEHRTHAREVYEALANEALDEDEGRSYDVKAEALRIRPEVRGASDPERYRAVFALLVGDGKGRGPDQLQAGIMLGMLLRQGEPSVVSELPPETRDPLAAYLVGKNLSQHGLYREGAEWLAIAHQRRTSLPKRVVRELERQFVISYCAQGEGPGKEGVSIVREWFDRRSPDDDPFRNTSGGRLAGFQRLLRRCGGPTPAK
ncbi:MAG: hypothetical protein U0174_09840 [Polyangiaceae bacterium]